MRKVVVYELLSLDGVAENPDAFISKFDDVMRANLARVIGTQDAVLLGRRTYDDWAAFWPGSTIEPFSSFINRVAKYVFTATTPEQQWAKTTVVEQRCTDFVDELRRGDGADIGVHGSLSLVHTLLDADLVDELRLVIAPALMISGRRLFERGGTKRLALTSSITSPSGYLLADYRVLRAG